MNKVVKFKEKATFQGKSLVFNLAFVLLNLTGLAFLVIGYHANFEEQSMLFKTLGMVLMILSIGGMVLFKGRMMMSSFARVLVGGLFIVSGLVKANDPIGFSYKLEEYFEDGALAFRIKEWFSAPGFSMEFFIDYALILSVLICIAEIVLGVLTIIGGKIKLVSYLMVLMMIFFTFLTWHTATCDASLKFVDRDTYAMTDPLAQMKIDEAKTNKELKIISKSSQEVVVDEMKMPQCVDDCGCFGDAMKGSVGRSLTPKESLWKDIVLLYLVIWIFIAQWIIKPNTRKENIKFTIFSMLVIVFFSWIFGWYFPILFGLVTVLGSIWVLRSGGKLLGNYFGGALFAIVISLVLVGYVLMYIPLKDYRPYAVGSNLIEKMNDGVDGVYESLLVYKNKKTGEKREYSSTAKDYVDSKIWEDKDWVYESMIQKAIIPTKIPSITDQFNPFVSLSDLSKYEKELEEVNSQIIASKVKGVRLLDRGSGAEIEVPLEEYNVTDYDSESYSFIDRIEMTDPNFNEISIRDFITKAPKIVVVSSKSLMEANWKNVNRLRAINNLCKKNNIPFVVICGANREQINEFRTTNKLYAPFFVNDETELKAISRSNPSLLVIEKGIVKAKYPFRSTPTTETFKTKHLK